MPRYSGMDDIRRLAGISHTSVFDLDEMSSDPVLRAAERMRDAKARGGPAELIKATEKRLKATTDVSKRTGIATAIEAELQANEKDYTAAQVAALRALQKSAGVVDKSRTGVAALAKADGGQTRKLVSGPGGTSTRYSREGDSILPAGRIDPVTGKNEYWDKGTAEVWSDGGKLFAVVTSNDRPYYAIGAKTNFRHDQTLRMLRRDVEMVGWFSIDPNGEYGGKVPTSGTLPVATYK